MGWPMTYARVINRNGLTGNYTETPDYMGDKRLIAGDLRRLEQDTLDRWHVSMYAKEAGITEDQVRLLFMLFFRGNYNAVHEWFQKPCHNGMKYEDNTPEYGKLPDGR